jgi:hypothetical protein
VLLVDDCESDAGADHVPADASMSYPVVLGSKRVSGEPIDKTTLRLVDSKTVGDGVAIVIHAPTRAQATGETTIHRHTASAATTPDANTCPEPVLSTQASPERASGAAVARRSLSRGGTEQPARQGRAGCLYASG